MTQIGLENTTTVGRADMVGSLMRPPKLLAARARFKRGEITPEALTEAEDQAIREALRRLRDIGYTVSTDGEMRRDAWMTGVSQVVSGFADEYPVVHLPMPDGTTEPVELHTKPIAGRLRKNGRFTDREFRFLAGAADGLCPKITIPSPAFLAWACYREDQGYGSVEELLADTTEIIRSEVEALREDGAGYVQLDEGFAGWTNRSTWESRAAAGIDLHRRLQQDIDAENVCHDVLSGAAVRSIHICLGNRTNYNPQVGGYDRIAEQVFTELRVDRFMLEYDSQRAGDFAPLRFIPEGKIAVLGLVTTKDAHVENPDDILRRIDEAARFCPVERLALSPQCGFFHGVDDDTMTLADQWRKLEFIVGIEQRVWGDSRLPG